MNTGKEFELKLDKHLKEYCITNNCMFVRSPTPFRSIPNEGGGFRVIYSEKALGDFVGIKDGGFVIIEAKVVGGASFAFSRLKEHQLEQMLKIKELGGQSFMFFYLKRYDKSVYMDISTYYDILNESERKSVHLDTLLELGNFVNLF